MSHQVKRCDELARKLRFFKDQVEKSGVTITAPITDEEKLVQFDEVEVGIMNGS
jgi:V-type H+-transporting ATPase subunit a